MAWGVAIWATRGWDAHGWIRIGVRMRFQALLGHFGPRGVGSGPFSIFPDFPYVSELFFLFSLLSPVWLAYYSPVAAPQKRRVAHMLQLHAPIISGRLFGKYWELGQDTPSLTRL